jgi:hypothetical protein
MVLFGEDEAADVQLTTQYFQAPPVSGVIPPAAGCPVKGKVTGLESRGENGHLYTLERME